MLPVLLGLLLACCVARAQGSPFEGKTITDVQVVPIQPLAPADLAKALPLQKGQPLRADEVANAIDGLFATGRFDDVVAEAEPSGDGVILRFVTKPKYFVGGLVVEGHLSVPPNRGQLVDTAGMTLGAPFRQQDMDRAVRRIKRVLEGNGFYEATITPSIERDENAQQMFFTLKIDERKRARYEQPVISGETKLSEGTIIHATGWRVPLIHWWRQVTETRTLQGLQGIKAKYQKQDRLTAKVELQKLDYQPELRRVRPTLSIDAGPKVKVKAIEAKVSKRTLKKYVPVFQEHAVNNALLIEGERNLRDYFQRIGYFDVDIDFRVLPVENDVETIEYVISRGPRHKLVKVNIEGNKYFQTEDIQERMFLHASAINMRHGRFSEGFVRKDRENITNLYRANGFRDVRVTAQVHDDYQGRSGRMAVTVKIDEGVQWLVDSLTVNGISQVDRDEVTALLASVEGQPFSEVNMANDRNSILTYYYEHGFPDAKFTSSWQPSGVAKHVNVVYSISEGEREYVRGIIVSGLRTTRRSLVDKHITMKAGEPLSPVEQSEIQRTFYNLGIFSRVDTAIENPDGDTAHKYVVYNFHEANRYTLAVGLGAQVGRFGTPSSNSLSTPAGSTGFAPSVSLDVSRLNFLGIGHTITLRGTFSSLQKRGSFNYFAPRFQNVEGRNITFTALYDKSLDVRTFASRRQEASIQISQRFSKATNGLFRLTYRRDSVTDVVIPVLLVPRLLQSERIGMLGMNLAQDHRNDPADPTRGMYNTADFELAGHFLGSQRSFSRVLVRNATYYKLTSRSVLARQTQFGVITPFAVARDLTPEQSIPLPERFYGGGAESIRAFPFNQAGPRDIGEPLVPGGPASQPTGFPLGGNALFFNNVEWRFPLIGENIRGVFFHDMGNIFTSLGDISLRFRQRNLQDFNYTVHAVGFGIRYQTPIGPIRLDLAYSINPPSFQGFKGTPADLLRCNPNLPPSQLPGACQVTTQNISHFQFFFSIGQMF